MSLSNPQKSLIKRAQRECALDDQEYRDALELVSGCRSSKDSALIDRHADTLLSYFEAIFWRKVDAGLLLPSGKANAVFRHRGYWKAKNSRQEKSRDRFTGQNVRHEIADLEGRLASIGFNDRYCAAIRSKVTDGRTDEHALHIYRTALDRTLRAKLKGAGSI